MKNKKLEFLMKDVNYWLEQDRDHPTELTSDSLRRAYRRLEEYLIEQEAKTQIHVNTEFDCDYCVPGQLCTHEGGFKLEDS